MYYKKIVLAIFTLALSACSMLGAKKTNTSPASTQPQETTIELADTNTENVSKTQNVVEAQNVEIAAALTTPAIAYPSASPITPAQTTAIVKPAQTETVNIGGQIGLLLNIAYPQAWIHSKKALSQAGYPVMEQDNASGTYYILDKIGTGGVIKRDTPIYQLHLQKTTDNKTTAVLNNAQNQPVDTKTAQRILSAFKKQLPN